VKEADAGDVGEDSCDDVSRDTSLCQTGTEHLTHTHTHTHTERERFLCFNSAG